MAQQMINERAYSPEAIRDLSRGAEIPSSDVGRGNGVQVASSCSSLTCGFAAVGGTAPTP